MGRGRVGIGKRKWSHINLTLREIDFDDEINNAPNKTRMKRLTERRVEVSLRFVFCYIIGALHPSDEGAGS